RRRESARRSDRRSDRQPGRRSDPDYPRSIGRIPQRPREPHAPPHPHPHVHSPGGAPGSRHAHRDQDEGVLMFLVFSSLFDPHVTPGGEHLRKAGADVKVLTCHDLARPGWRLSLAEEPTLVVEGKRVPARRIRGVLTRLAWVTHHELPFLRAEDREYGAAEMQAFLLALLDRLSCPVLNRATPGSLNGPGWSPERWTRCAAELGLAVQPIVRRTYAGGAVLARPAAPSRRILQVVG